MPYHLNKGYDTQVSYRLGTACPQAAEEGNDP